MLNWFKKKKRVRVVTSNGTYDMSKGDILMLEGCIPSHSLELIRDIFVEKVGEGTRVWTTGSAFHVHGVIKFGKD
jgi:hypothetical protein